MGMGVLGWFWVMVSFYGIFFSMTGFECTWLCSLTLWKRGVWPTIEAAKGCVLVLVRGCLGRIWRVFVGCWTVWRRGVFRASEGLSWWVKCAEWVEKAWFAVRMSWVGLKVLLSASAGVGWGAVCWFVVAEGHYASHDGRKSSSCR